MHHFISESIDLVVASDGFLYIMEIVHIFHSGYLDYREAIQTVLDPTLLCNKLNTADREE